MKFLGIMKVYSKLEKSGLDLKFVILNLENKKELEDYFDLFNICFGKKDHINKELFEWFNLMSPNQTNFTFAFIDEKTNQIISAYGLLPRLAMVNQKLVSFCLCTNVMTHPNYGGKGLFKQIGKEALAYVKKQGFSFCVGIPNKQAIRGHLSIGWNLLNEVHFYQLNFDKTILLQENQHVKVGELLQKSDDFYHGMFYNRDFYTLRTKDWMSWRYSKTNSKYNNFLIETTTGSAYIVTKEFWGDGEKKMHIVDYGYSTIDSLNELLPTIQNYGTKEGFDLINLWLYNSNLEEVKLFEKFNYYQTESLNEVIIHKLDNEINLPLSNWHLTLFDNDVY